MNLYEEYTRKFSSNVELQSKKCNSLNNKYLSKCRECSGNNVGGYFDGVVDNCRFVGWRK